MAAVRALEAGETGGEVAAFVELIDHGAFAERAVGLAVRGLVVCEERSPAVVDDLPEG